jgi:ABC-type uncharacterized transport system substrate-binding protein
MDLFQCASLCRYRPETSGSVMRRREFITLLGGVVAWPLTARAQQADRVMRIGVLMSYVESDTTAHQWTKAFSQSLQESGWIDNQNIKFEYRWAGPNPDLLQANAAELVRLRPNLLMAGATPALVALQRETRDIPIVFANVADPVGQGFVASLAHPGGNTTGFGAFDFSMGGKWVQTLKEIVPSTTRIAVIFNPATAPFYQSFLSSIDNAARSIGVSQIVTPVHDVGDIARILEQSAKEANVGLIVGLCSQLREMKLSRRSRGYVCRLFIPIAILRKTAAFCLMVSRFATCIGGQGIMLIASSRAPSLPIFQYSSQLNLSW